MKQDRKAIYEEIEQNGYSIILGDSFEKIELIEENSISLIYGSPPYPNAKRNYKTWEIKDYIKLMSDFLIKALPKLKDDGFIVINVKANREKGTKDYSSERSLVIEKLMIEMNEKFKLYCVDIEIWLKSNPVPTGLRVACQDAYEYNLWFSKSPKWTINIDAIRRPYANSSLRTYESTIFKPRKNGLQYVYSPKKIKPNKKGALPKNVFINEQDELIKYILADELFIKKFENQLKDLIAKMSTKEKSELIREYTNVVYGAVSGKSVNHQAVQPDYIPERYILACTNEDDIILDPWVGSGTTGIVALKNNRKFIGIEISKEFLNLAVKNLEMEKKKGNNLGD